MSRGEVKSEVADSQTADDDILLHIRDPAYRALIQAAPRPRRRRHNKVPSSSSHLPLDGK